MAPLEAIFIWVAIGIYGLTTGIYMYSFVFGNERLLGRAGYFICAAFIFQTAAIAVRYNAVGNMPLTGVPYENALGTTWFIMLFMLYVYFRHKTLRPIGVAVLPFTLVMLGYGVMSSPALMPMVASVKSFWLYIHVYFAWLAFGSYAVSFGLGVIYLLKERDPEREFYRKFPDLLRMDDLMFRYIIFGFITDAVMIASGAIWAKDLWGSYWSWDPVETWSLVTWLIYGLSIHLRLTMGWMGKRLAYIAIFALSGMVITYFGINWFVESSLHVFEARPGI